MSSNGILSIIGWYIIPDLATNFLVKAILATNVVRPVDRATLYKQAYAAIIVAYLAFSVYDAYHSVKYESALSGNDLYQILGVSTHAPMDEIRKKYRRISQISHPDKQNGSNDGKYIQIMRAYEILRNNVFRFGYDRLGPDYFEIHATNKDPNMTMNDIIQKAFVGAVRYYSKYVASLALLYSLFGFGRNTLWWRYLTIASCFILEVFIITRDETIISSITGLQQYQQVQFVHSLLMTISVGTNQLAPLFGSNSMNSVEESVDVIQKTSENVNKMARQIFELETAPVKKSKKNEMSKMIYETSMEMSIESHPIVQEATSKYRE